MSDANRLAGAFGKAVAAGTLAGGGPLLLFTIPISLAQIVSDPAQGLIFALYPLLAAAMFVVPLSVLIGLPLHFAVRRLEMLYAPVMIGAGLFAGFMAPWVIGWLWFGIVPAYFCLWGGFSGGVTAWQWTRSLERFSVAFS